MKRFVGSGRGARAALLAAGLGLGLAACGGGDAVGEQSATATATEIVLAPEDVAVVQRAEISDAISLTGSLDPYRVAEVRAQVPGTVADLRVDRGQPVRAGQVMGVIQAEGIRSQAAGAQAGVAAAEAQLAFAQRQLESARTLYEAGAMSEIDFRGAQTQFEASQAQVAAARAAAVGAGEQARRATITAPFAGEVSKRLANEGEAVNPGQAIFEVVNTEVLELAGQVPANDAPLVRAGQPVEFALSAYPGRSLRGTVARVEPTADPTTRQVGVYVQLPNPGRVLVGGLFASGRILTGSTRNAVTVPASAVRAVGAESYVWVIEDGVAARRAVTLGPRDEARGLVAVTAGLRGGEQVVVAPGNLQEGARVRVGAGATEARPAAAGAS